MNPVAVLPLSALAAHLPSTPPGPLVIDCSGADRLPSDALASLAAEGRAAQLNGASSAIRDAVAVLRTPVLLLAPPQAQHDLPFALRVEADGTVVVVPEAGAGQHPRLNDGPGHAWIPGIQANRYAADLLAIEHVNSVMVAWLLQISQQIRPCRLELRNASRQVATQLRQLRLDHLMPLV